MIGSYVAIDWRDVRAYADDGLHDPTVAYTEGVLARESERYMTIRNPETLVMRDLRNHPKRRAAFCSIPKALIIRLTVVSP